MSLTVSKMLNMKEFEGMDIIAGKNGIDREISNVTIVDAPDFDKWLAGGEFLLTTGYIFLTNPGLFVQMLKRFDKAKAACIGIKLERFLGNISTDEINFANDISFPIISIPNKFRFTEIIIPVLEKITLAQSAEIELSENIHRSFTDIVIRGGDESSIITTLADLIGCDIVYVDTFFDREFSSSENCNFTSDIKKDHQKALSKYRNVEIKIDHITYGHLFINTPRKTHFHSKSAFALEHAETVLKFEIKKREMEHQIEKRYRDEFIQALLLNRIRNIEDIKKYFKLFDWKMENGWIVFLMLMNVRFDRPVPNHNLKQQYNQQIAHSKLISEVKKSFPHSIYTSIESSDVFILPAAIEGVRKFYSMIENIYKKLREERNEEIYIGIGGYKDDPRKIYQSYDEAVKAIDFADWSRLDKKIVKWESMGVFRFFNFSERQEFINAFVYENIGVLIEYERKTGVEVIKTLRTMIENQWSLKKTSQTLGIHYNSVKQRYQKILSMLTNENTEKLNLENVILSLHIMDAMIKTNGTLSF